MNRNQTGNMNGFSLPVTDLRDPWHCNLLLYLLGTGIGRSCHIARAAVQRPRKTSLRSGQGRHPRRHNRPGAYRGTEYIQLFFHDTAVRKPPERP